MVGLSAAGGGSPRASAESFANSTPQKSRAIVQSLRKSSAKKRASGSPHGVHGRPRCFPSAAAGAGYAPPPPPVFAFPPSSGSAPADASAGAAGAFQSSARPAGATHVAMRRVGSSGPATPTKSPRHSSHSGHVKGGGDGGPPLGGLCKGPADCAAKSDWLGIQSSPLKGRTKTKVKATYDRFIPNRNAMDLVSSQFNVTRKDVDGSGPSLMTPSDLAYQESVAKACGIALDKRILAFNKEAPESKKDDLKASWSRPLRPATSSLAKRKIPGAPERVLDAPGLLDDYYLNLLDWSSTNLLAIGLENTVYLWNAETGTVVDFCHADENDSISSLSFIQDGSYLAVGTSEGDTQIWDIESNSKIRSMSGHAARVGVLSWDRHILSSGCRDGSIWHHDVRVAQHKVMDLRGHGGEVCGLEWRQDGGMLASGGNDNLVNIWDARSNQPRATKTEHKAAVKALAWCPWQINTLATGGGSADRTINFWNASTSAKVSSIDSGSQVTSIIWSLEYKELITSHGFPNNHLSLWHYPTLKKVADLEGHDARVLHTTLSPDGQVVASSASDENLKFWRVWEERRKKDKDGAKGKEEPGAPAIDGVDNLLGMYSKMRIR